MIELARGNLLEAQAEALVNTVNTVGVMGKGIALQFKQAYPLNFHAYKRACEQGEVLSGRMFVFHTGTIEWPRLIINFPTKRHWRAKTRLADIDAGLQDLLRVIQEEQVRSIAIPPLGCGNGGLDWGIVRPRIEVAFAQLSSVKALLYAPEGPPEAAKMPVQTLRPRMTAGRAAVVGLLANYLLPGYTATLLEMQKLTYFLQAAGEPLKLNFLRGQFGPYAENLNHSLQRMEGHFIRGYGDRSSGASIELMPGAAEEAREFLWGGHESMQRLKRVAHLIEGFETPFSLELLASLHWLEDVEGLELNNASTARRFLREWSPRKEAKFDSFQIEVALTHLHSHGWLESTSFA